MDFFDKLGKKASETYKATGKLAKETKLKLKMNDFKSQVDDVYHEIGRKVYERHEEGKKSVSFEKDLAEEMKKIEGLTHEIAKLNEEILSLKNLIKCSSCDKQINKDDNFCSNCGAKVEKKEEECEVFEGEIVDEETTKIPKEDNKKEEHKKNSNEKDNKDKKDEKAKSELEKTVKIESDLKRKE